MNEYQLINDSAVWFYRGNGETFVETSESNSTDSMELKIYFKMGVINFTLPLNCLDYYRKKAHKYRMYIHKYLDHYVTQRL
jgi:hypothetical protein